MERTIKTFRVEFNKSYAIIFTACRKLWYELSEPFSCKLHRTRTQWSSAGVETTWGGNQAWLGSRWQFGNSRQKMGLSRDEKDKKKLIFVILFVSYMLTNRRRHVSVMWDVCEGQWYCSQQTSRRAVSLSWFVCTTKWFGHCPAFTECLQQSLEESLDMYPNSCPIEILSSK